VAATAAGDDAQPARARASRATPAAERKRTTVQLLSKT
jgi:hypothetical protein